MPDPGFHTVRSHVRRNPGSGRKKTSGWVIAAIAVAGFWVVTHLGGTAAGSTTTPPSPSASASASAAVGH
ncbi:hypothetical protein [Streptacidiphilus sp. EB103A]|uniref:hypothetical protein n=1 Tax=Streptacidiphilus sp. EB103A TaxID=3156275 RepID=UPI003517DFAC